MRDVTPAPAALPAPGAPRPKRARKARAKAAPRPSAKPRWRAKPFARAEAPGAPSVPNGGRWEARSGAVPYRLFSPAAPDPDAPLIVMLHGCTQDPEDFSRGTRMNHAAGALGAHVIWPEQARAANANGCWNWFEPAHQGRGGEPGAIASVIEAVRAETGARGGAHVAGLSAGGAMAAVLGARFPEAVASVGIHSGPAGGLGARRPPRPSRRWGRAGPDRCR